MSDKVFSDKVFSDKTFNVLFLGLGNTTRSIIAESILNSDGSGRFRAFSAGTQPAGQVDPIVLSLLSKENYLTDGLRSKSQEEFIGPAAPVMDFIFTVCDLVAGDTMFPGQPMTAHWGVPDPRKFDGSAAEKTVYYADVLRMLRNRISVFCALPIQVIDRLSLQRSLDGIGHDQAGTRAPEPSVGMMTSA